MRYRYKLSLFIIAGIIALCSIHQADAQPLTTIDIMVVYTPGIRRYAETNLGGIDAVIQGIMQTAQQVLDNSAAMTTLRLVYAGEVFSDTQNADLRRLASPDDGYMDEIHEWRDQYGADLVSLLFLGPGGFGFQLPNLEGNPEYGFSVVGVEVTDINTIAKEFTHEIGHNLGCHHSVYQRYLSGPGLFPYSAGWYFTGESGGKICYHYGL